MSRKIELQDIINFFAINKSYAARMKFMREKYANITIPKTNAIQFIYDLVHEIKDIPKCYCGNDLPFFDFVSGYSRYCGHKCSVGDQKTKVKRNQTMIERYGAEYNSILSEKRKATMVERYGVEHALQHKEFAEKSVKSFKKNDIAEIINKKNATIKERYGVDNIWDADSFRDKIKETNIKKYGCEWGLQNNSIIEKSSNTRKENFFAELVNRFENVKPAFDITEYSGINIYQGGSGYNWECKTCNKIFYDTVTWQSPPVCPYCNPTVGDSKGEQELKDFLESLDVPFIHKNNKIIYPLQVDFVLPHHNMAIEYCGLYWHSEKKGRGKTYHKNKLEKLRLENIRLITIFEDEWLNNKDLCKNRIKHALGLNDKKRIHARKCQIAEITTKQYKDFVNINHIQGYTNTGIKIGAFYDSELVAVMGFGQLRKVLGHNKKENTFEMIRFCSSSNVPGIAGKLFKYFITNNVVEEVISYCDLRWGSGNLYEKLGFIKLHETEPNYWYSRDGISRHYRYKFNKKSLINRGFDKNMTEEQIMQSLGYYRIWDCGSIVFSWKK